MASLPLRAVDRSSATNGPAWGLAGDEGTFVAGIRAGDERAFEVVFRKYVDGLLVFAEGYVRSAAVAEEIVADVFLSIWANRSTFAVTDSVAAYLYTAVRNRAIRSLDRERRARRWEADAVRGERAPAVSTAPAAADTHVYATDITAATTRALEAMPERPRTVFLLCRQHGLSYADIGAALGISARTVEGHMARAVATLREHLADFL